MRQGDVKIVLHVDRRKHTLQFFEMQSFPMAWGLGDEPATWDMARLTLSY